MFKATVEKLEKGWDVTVSAPTFEEASSIIVARHLNATPSESGEASPFRASVRRLKDGSYRATFYQSTLTEAQETIKGLYKSGDTCHNA